MPDIPWSHATIALLSIIGTCDGQQIVNTHHFEAGGTVTPPITDDSTAQQWSAALVDDWITSLKTTWNNCHTSDYTLNMLRCQVIERTGLWRHKLSPVERAQSTANVGTLLGTAESLQTAANIKWSTPQAGKSHRGRTYVGPMPNNLIVSGRLATSGSESANYKNYADAMIGRYGALGGSQNGSYRLTIYSRPYNHGEYAYPQGRNPNRTFFYPDDYGGNSTNVTVAVVDPIVRTQRRREVGVGA